MSNPAETAEAPDSGPSEALVSGNYWVYTFVDGWIQGRIGTIRVAGAFNAPDLVPNTPSLPSLSGLSSLRLANGTIYWGNLSPLSSASDLGVPGLLQTPNGLSRITIYTLVNGVGVGYNNDHRVTLINPSAPGWDWEQIDQNILRGLINGTIQFIGRFIDNNPGATALEIKVNFDSIELGFPFRRHPWLPFPVGPALEFGIHF